MWISPHYSPTRRGTRTCEMDHVGATRPPSGRGDACSLLLGAVSWADPWLACIWPLTNPTCGISARCSRGHAHHGNNGISHCGPGSRAHRSSRPNRLPGVFKDTLLAHALDSPFSLLEDYWQEGLGFVNVAGTVWRIISMKLGLKSSAATAITLGAALGVAQCPDYTTYAQVSCIFTATRVQL